MTDTLESPADAAPTAAPKKRSGGLNAMLLADLRSMAAGMGISQAGGMKKAQLVEAIKAAQAGSAPAAQAAPAASAAPAARRSKAPAAARDDDEKGTQGDQGDQGTPERPQARSSARDQGSPDQVDRGQENEGPKNEGPKNEGQRNQKDRGANDRGANDRGANDRGANDKSQGGQAGQGGQDSAAKAQAKQPAQQPGNQPGGQQGGQQADQGDGDEDGRGGRNRRRRGRDRTRAAVGTPPGSSQRNEPDTTVLEDDVLVPAAGILDVLDNYAFVRTSGYLPGADDVYLSLSMVRKFGLRRGDAVVGQVRQPREGERKEKFNPMVRIDSVNGSEAQQPATRPEFDRLTPVDPTERLRLETEPTNLVGRAIDLTAPIGKGQRGLVVAPPKAGKTLVLKAIAASVTANNPECHLMVVLVDERPEEVTEFERSVKGEVIASTFDRPPGDHTLVAELAIERAKRLVELGHDVVLLLDGITRLGRAYNLSLPASGRILSGGVDAAALHPPKRFFGAARNIENGGSLTIIATALVESGSRMDEVILEELVGTDNMELRLRRELVGSSDLPAIDAALSGTRRADLLMSEQELAIVGRLRGELAAAGEGRSSQLLRERLTGSATNIELLTRLQRSSGQGGGK